MEEMPSLNRPVQRLKVATLPLDLPCSGPVTISGEISVTGKSHGKKPDRFSILMTWERKILGNIYWPTRENRYGIIQVNREIYGH